ncbi:hypothetical protein [Euzebya tangerina]|uniref:hypothetical protein n=1 Tax=Euzebya tangerina TaxID=591198 RepID=UPI0013C36DDE|nr:hypothetical protein [Euzebya tangerina]
MNATSTQPTAHDTRATGRDRTLGLAATAINAVATLHALEAGERIDDAGRRTLKAAGDAIVGVAATARVDLPGHERSSNSRARRPVSDARVVIAALRTTPSGTETPKDASIGPRLAQLLDRLTEVMDGRSDNAAQLRDYFESLARAAMASRSTGEVLITSDM